MVLQLYINQTIRPFHPIRQLQQLYVLYPIISDALEPFVVMEYKRSYSFALSNLAFIVGLP